jgi:alanyl-tRNA synthetase
MDGPYPELVENTQANRKVLKFEEERFAHTLSSGMSILDELMDKIKSSGEDTIPGPEIFKLYDTFGFPLDLAKDIAEDNGLKIDEQGFTGEMELQKTRARASWVGAKEEVSRGIQGNRKARWLHGIYRLRNPADRQCNYRVNKGRQFRGRGDGRGRCGNSA